MQQTRLLLLKTLTNTNLHGIGRLMHLESLSDVACEGFCSV